MTEAKIRPFPEAISRRWKVKETHAVPGLPCTNKSRKLMEVPMGDDPLHFAIRLHEMGHAAFSPKILDPDAIEAEYCYRATLESLNAAEEARINVIIESQGFDLSDLVHPLLDRAGVTMLAAKSDWLGLLRTGTASLGSGRWDVFSEVVAELVPEPMRRYLLNQVAAWKQYFEREHGLRSTAMIGQAIDALAEELDRIAAAKAKEVIRTRAGEAQMAKIAAKAGSDPSGIYSKMSEPTLEGIGDGYEGTTKGKWAPMRITKPSLTKALSGRWKRSRIPMEEGDIPRNIHRMAVDGRIFTHRVRKQGGSILIDCSGSMSLQTADILSLVKSAPGATIALYGGTGGGQGELRVVAKKGYVCDESMIDSPGGANEVDGPALEWLAGEEEPRVWVCDGAVTGMHDQVHGNLNEEARMIAKVARVIRLDDMETALEFFARHRMRMQ